jgi:hypothetical protein
MRILPSCLVVAAVAQLGATDCDGGITRDPGFDLWCGDLLCAWKLERGEVRRAPTWHADDSGVELLGGDSAIEQFTPADSRDGTCIRFDLISDAAEDAAAELGVDIYGDGTIEQTFPIPAAHWKPLSYEFAVAAPFTGIRFEIAKRGPGRAVVARMRASVVPGTCAGLPSLFGGPAPPGALCNAAEDCATGICAHDSFGSAHCAKCDPTLQACGAGQVCGVGEPGPAERVVPLDCVAAGARELGEQCLLHAECATGLCNLGMCSTCATDSDCDGRNCRQAYGPGPYLCEPGTRSAASGEPCATDADCASASCLGPPRLQCADGRACATDANCPVEGLIPGPCVTMGVQGGRCQ